MKAVPRVLGCSAKEARGGKRWLYPALEVRIRVQRRAPLTYLTMTVCGHQTHEKKRLHFRTGFTSSQVTRQPNGWAAPRAPTPRIRLSRRGSHTPIMTFVQTLILQNTQRLRDRVQFSLQLNSRSTMILKLNDIICQNSGFLI